MTKKISLKKILSKYPTFTNEGGYGEYYVIEAMREACQEILKLAAENADYGVYQNDDGQEPWIHESNIFVNKQSILDTINQIE